MGLRLALHYDVREPAGTPSQAARRNQGLVEHTARAEASGFDVVWLAEHPTDPDAAIPSALILCAAIAARTQTLRVGTGVLPLPLYHPLRVAEDAASIDGLADGRFELGVGLGGELEGFQGFGIEARERTGRLEESIALLRQAWSEQPVNFKGAHFEIEDIEVVPKPIQVQGPPLWIGAGAAEAQRRAARLGVGLFVRKDVSPDVYVAAWEERELPASEARVALLAGDLALPEDIGAFEELAGRVGSIDFVVPAIGAEGLRDERALEDFAAAFRQRFPQ